MPRRNRRLITMVNIYYLAGNCQNTKQKKKNSESYMIRPAFEAIRKRKRSTRKRYLNLIVRGSKLSGQAEKTQYSRPRYARAVVLFSKIPNTRESTPQVFHAASYFRPYFRSPIRALFLSGSPQLYNAFSFLSTIALHKNYSVSNMRTIFVCAR